MINLFLRLTLQRLWCNRTAKVVKIKKLSTIGQEFFCYFYLLSFRLTLPHAGASLQLVPIIIELAAPHAGASLQLVPNSKFTILSPSYSSHLSYPSHNSKFKIHNLPIPLALFKALYRLKKRLSLWCIKGNSRAVIFLFY